MTPDLLIVPLYIDLYDEVRPDLRDGFRAFLPAVAAGLERRGVTVAVADICTRTEHVAAALAAPAAVVATLHLAYSPSLEALPALLADARPLVLLDTTMDGSFGPDTPAERILYNHGVHGVMDLASVLNRHERPFAIVAGALDEAFLARAATVVHGGRAAARFRSMRLLRVGPTFAGMGDFAVSEVLLAERFGLRVAQCAPAELAVDGAGTAAVAAEVAADVERFTVACSPTVHERAVRACLALRTVLDAGDYGGLSVNFQTFADPAGPAMPFRECSLAMARGLGYAGEGDVLTAALVGALGTAFGTTTFTEIFCADWDGNSLFLSHMGELNPEVVAGRPLLREVDSPFVGSGPTVMIAGAIRPGPAVYVNLAPIANDEFRLIVAPGEVLGDSRREDMQGTVRGWFRPRLPVAAFLEAYSRLGGTHHAALVLGDRLAGVQAFARCLGIECTTIDPNWKG